MKRILILAFVAAIFVGCGTVTYPTKTSTNTIKPDERCR